MKSFFSKTVLCLLLSVSFLSHGAFNLDLQGLDKDYPKGIERTYKPPKMLEPTVSDEEQKRLKEESARNSILMDLELEDLRVVADRTVKSLIELGTPRPTPLYGFGSQVTLNEFLKTTLPEGWAAYSKENFEAVTYNKIFWKSEGQPWTKAYEIIGNNLGLSFIVDWDENKIYIKKFADVNEFKPMPYVALEGEDERVFIQTGDKSTNQRIIFHEGKRYRVKIIK